MASAHISGGSKSSEANNNRKHYVTTDGMMLSIRNACTPEQRRAIQAQVREYEEREEFIPPAERAIRALKKNRRKPDCGNNQPPPDGRGEKKPKVGLSDKRPSVPSVVKSAVVGSNRTRRTFSSSELSTKNRTDRTVGAIRKFTSTSAVSRLRLYMDGKIKADEINIGKQKRTVLKYTLPEPDNNDDCRNRRSLLKRYDDRRSKSTTSHTNRSEIISSGKSDRNNNAEQRQWSVNTAANVEATDSGDIIESLSKHSDDEYIVNNSNEQKPGSICQMHLAESS